MKRSASPFFHNSSSSIKIRSENLLSELEASFLSTPKLHNENSWMDTYYFSNDNELCKILPQLAEWSASQSYTSEARKIKVAIIVGNGHVMSLSSLIKADVILICDCDPNLLDWMRLLIDSYCNSENETQLMELIHQKVSLKSSLSKCIVNELRNEQVYLGKHHYLHTTQIQHCKDSLTSKKLAYIQVDLSDITQMQQLKTVLLKHHAEISFMNLTNVWQWVSEDACSGYKQSLTSLPYNEMPCIIYSSNFGLGVGSFPIFKPICHSIEQYIDFNERNMENAQSIAFSSH